MKDLNPVIPVSLVPNRTDSVPLSPSPPLSVSVSDGLNQACHCLTLDPAALAEALDSTLGVPGLAEALRTRCPSVFAAQPVFVGAAPLQRMAQVVRAIETVVALPAWQAHALADAPPAARVTAPPGLRLPRGVFYGHDFHLDRGQLGLIEVNTNAGGALLNCVLARAQRACCEEIAPLAPTDHDAAAFEQAIVAMFHAEWAWTGRTTPLRTIAIVDDTPEAQYLYPEFLLFQRLFARHGLHTVIADPSTLTWRDGRLWHRGLPDTSADTPTDTPIDLVYNRLTDFYFEQPASAALRQAWNTQTAVITPHPQAHALYADKRHLAVFSDAAALQALGVPPDAQALLLAHVPRTEVVRRADADRLWAARRGLFFKPAGGFGSRAAWRGDKLTRRVWEEITARDGAYVAQAVAHPGQRQLQARPEGAEMKFDLRTYAYDGQVQWVAARLYQGQTTNFRTPGGGFAPVYSTCC